LKSYRFLTYILIFLLSLSCTRTIIEVRKEIVPVPSVASDVKGQAQQPQLPPGPEIPVKPKSIDQQVAFDLNKIWETYFHDDFTDTRSIDLFVATNRKLKNGTMGCTDDLVGVEADALLKLGICRINVPKNHSTGEINFTRDNRKSSHEFFKVVSFKSLLEDKFIENIKKSKRIPLIFVHGFNVKYQEAVLRATQLAYDLKYQGPVILFTWPAGAGDGFLDDKLINVTYKNNTKTALESVSFFKNFLNLFKKNDIKINLIVHSMGHQVVLPALNAWVRENSQQAPVEKREDASEDGIPINELILNAPDFESDKFVELTENLKTICRRITLYCSYNDNAMAASEMINKTKRLGACALVEGIDSINVSLLQDKGALGHGYYSTRPILTDVFQVLIGLDAHKRLFIRKSEPNSTERYYLRP
jgi:esterase/lipase superfamily enzyme